MLAFGRRLNSRFAAVEIPYMSYRLSAAKGAALVSVARILTLVIAAVIFAVRLASAAGEPPANAPPPTEIAPSASAGRPLDQLWLVSCRHVVDRDRDGGLSQLTYTVHHAATGWAAANQQTYQHAAAPTLTTCVLVLGNGYTASQTRSLGQTAYHRLVSGLSPELAVRFVIWSWPSDHTDAGPVKDLRIKAGRTPHVAHCLARWLDEASSPGPMSLLGTSFGARIVFEALELRGGGRVGNRQLTQPASAARPKFNVVLISAAVDNDWLLPGRRLDLALSQADRVLLINNSSDVVLKRYHWLYGRRSTNAALGSTGLRGSSRLGAYAGRIAQIDAAPIIGRHHGCQPYFESPRLVSSMRAYLFDARDAKEPPSPQILPKEGAPVPIASGGQEGVRN